MIDPVALKAELDNDPSGVGYALDLASGSNSGLVALLNEPRAAEPVDRGVVPAHKVVSATDFGELATLDAVQRNDYDTITGAGEVDASDGNIRAVFAAMFPAGSVTRPKLLALGTRDGSRIEMLFGVGLAASLDDVRKAVRL